MMEEDKEEWKMAFDAAENVTVEGFFKEYLLNKLTEIRETADLSWLAGKEFTANYKVNGLRYGMSIKNGTDLEVVDGGIDQAMLEISMSEKFWRDMATGKIESGMDSYILPGGSDADKDRYNALQDIRGTLKIKMEVGSEVEEISMVLNGDSQPEAIITIALEDFVSINKGETDGPSMVMNGKLKIDGDIAFLLSVQEML
jgi:putative sterol carrier protein